MRERARTRGGPRLAQWSGPWYFSWLRSTPFCCCSLIFTTSNGVTIARASMTPAPNPEASRPDVDTLPSAPRKRDSKEALVPMRSAYLSVRWVAKGVKP